MRTSLLSIDTDTSDRYSFLLALGELLVRVVVSTVGDTFGAHAVVVTGERFPAEDAYLVNTDLRPLPAHAIGRGDVESMHRHRLLWGLASDVERAVGRVDAEQLAALEARYVVVPEPVEVAAPVVVELSDDELDAQAAWEAELDADADRAFAEDRERLAAEGTWWGRGDAELAF